MAIMTTNALMHFSAGIINHFSDPVNHKHIHHSARSCVLLQGIELSEV